MGEAAIDPETSLRQSEIGSRESSPPGRHHLRHMRILLTGASGFIGSKLVPQLLAEGHDLRAVAREPARVRSALADNPEIEVIRPQTKVIRPQIKAIRPETKVIHPEIEVIRGDVLSAAGLKQAMHGVEVAYYLVHAMESQPAAVPPQSPFPVRERVGARNFATAAARAGIRRIVYLGGLQPREGPASRHLASRAEVEEIIFARVPDSVALRASIVLGARSRSFRLLVRLVERMPVLALPAWRRFRTQPIDARDVVEMLAAAAHVRGVGGATLDIGGPEALTYEAMLRRIAELLLVSRPAFPLKVTMTPLAGRLVAALTGEDPELIIPLMEGLEGDLLPADDRAAQVLGGVELHSFEDAVECALREWETVEPLAAR
jgi:uncharacterized protein YbjT (DUF2867 family)